MGTHSTDPAMFAKKNGLILGHIAYEFSIYEWIIMKF